MAETIISYAIKHDKRTASTAAVKGIPPLIAAALARSNGR